MPYDTLPAQDVQVVELRQYTLRPGGRDTLLELFERYFIDAQEAAGIRVLGRYRDAADPNRLAWLRGFRDMATRAESLQAFYGGPIWKAHRDAANATMVDSDDVLLLRPVSLAPPAKPLAAGAPAALTLATIYLAREPIDDAFVRFFREDARPLLEAAGGAPVAAYRTEYAANNFPALPVRSGEHAFVWLASFEGAAQLEAYLAKIAASGPWTQRVLPALQARLASAPRELRLEAARRDASALGGVHDFDFVAGEWRIANRRLKQRGVGSGEWDEFPAASRATLHLGGVANVDEVSFPTKGWSGMTLRAYDRERAEWSIWWINSRDGKMLSPVRGSWFQGTGTFRGVDEDEGRPIDVVFTWKRLSPDAARWEQAFSYDGGRTWETNWVMDLSR